MSFQKIINPGLGIGSAFGTPSTISVTGTYTMAAGSYIVAANSAVGTTTGVFIAAQSTTNGVTATYVIMGANQPGDFVADGSAVVMVGTATVSLISF